MRLSEACVGRIAPLVGKHQHARGQFCGERARFEIPYADGSGKYVACANCDGLAHFPVPDTPKEPA